MHKPDIQALIFDLDGLVLDTETTFVQAWQTAALQLGMSLSTAFLQNLSGLPHGQVQQAIKHYCGAAFDYARFQQLSGECWREQVKVQGIPVKSGLFQVLQVVQEQQLPYCLATNSQAADAIYCLQLAGIYALFPLLVSRDDVVQPKPPPDIFLKAAALLEVNIQNCLVLEDSATGVAAAFAATTARWANVV